MKINGCLSMRLNLCLLVFSSILQKTWAVCYNGIAANCEASEKYQCSPCSECHANYVLSREFFEWHTFDDVPVKVNFGGRCRCPDNMLKKVVTSRGWADRYGWTYREPLVGEMLLNRAIEYVCLNNASISVPKIVETRFWLCLKFVGFFLDIFGHLAYHELRTSVHNTLCIPQFS